MLVRLATIVVVENVRVVGFGTMDVAVAVTFRVPLNEGFQLQVAVRLTVGMLTQPPMRFPFA